MDLELNRFHHRVLRRVRRGGGLPTRADSWHDVQAARLPLYEAEGGARRLV